jgi:hypothetical protein
MTEVRVKTQPYAFGNMRVKGFCPDACGRRFQECDSDVQRGLPRRVQSLALCIVL